MKMNKFTMVFVLLAAALFLAAPSVKAQPVPQPEPYVLMVCNINGQLYNIDQNYGIYAFNGFYMGQLVAAQTPSGWIAVRSDGVQFPVLGCR
jgi:hypothetical protein